MGENQGQTPQEVRMSQKPLVSVLVAVYNSANYLPQCLDSLLRQTCQSVEVIAIDDCSTDDSLSILHDYAEKDARVKVLSLASNQGQAKARNAGLEIAQGEWIATVDSDDWLAPDAIEKTIVAVEGNDEIDVAVFQLMDYYSDDNCHPYPLAGHLSVGQVLTGKAAFELSLDWQLHGLYLVRADIHKTYPFDTSCRLYSDDNTTRLHYLHARNVVITDGRYFYRKHPQSATNSVSINRFLYLDANMSMKRQLQEEAKAGFLPNAEEVLNRYETIRWLNIVDACWYIYCHRREFDEQQRQFANGKIRRAFDSIERQRISPQIRRKFGYYPFKSFSLFRLAEIVYFFLRRVAKKLMPKQ